MRLRPRKGSCPFTLMVTERGVPHWDILIWKWAGACILLIMMVGSVSLAAADVGGRRYSSANRVSIGVESALCSFDVGIPDLYNDLGPGDFVSDV